MPDTGTTGKPEESERRTQLVATVAENDESLSCASCPTCPGPRRTSDLHLRCTPVASTQAGKGIDAEVDNKLNVASSSSSSRSAPAQDKGKSLQSTPTQEADTEDGPVSPEKKNQEAGVCRADKVADDKAASEQYWKDYDPLILRDLPEEPGASYGRGHCQQLAAQSRSPSNANAIDNPIDNPMDGIEPEEITTSVQCHLVTLCFASFALDPANHEGGRTLTSSTDERHESVPEGVRLDVLDLLHRFPGGANAGEPSSMDDQEQEV